MNIKIISDSHIFGVDAVYKNIDSMPQCDYLLGDIIDMANVKKDLVNKAKNDQLRLMEKFGNKYISGNHDLLMTNTDQLIEDSVLLTHGDFPLWGVKRATEYRTQSAGAGGFSRFWKRGIDSLRKVVPAHLSKDEKDALANYAKQRDAKTIILGHIHPKELIDILWDDVRIVVCKKGLNQIVVLKK